MLRTALALLAVGISASAASFDFSAYERQVDPEQAERLREAMGQYAAPPEETRRLSPSMAGAVEGLRDQGLDAVNLRNQTMKQMGMRTEEVLYVFLSHSMPEALLKSYIREAMWYGGIVVMRGFPEGHDLKSWIREYANDLVSGKSVMAEIRIDPVPYDLYGVERVPTVVWDENPQPDDCAETFKAMAVDDRGDMQQIDRCTPKGIESFYRMSGSVTLDYALGEFGKAGAERAEERMGKGREFLEPQGNQLQEPYQGDWQSEPSPAEQQRLAEIAERIQRGYREYKQATSEFVQ